MRNALCLEAFGTFFLCLAVAVAGEPLAVAAVLGALIYAGGPISGAHYNPAATLAWCCLLYTSPSPRDLSTSRMPSSA